MQKSDNSIKAQSAHRRMTSSTTLNRRYVKRPAKYSDVAVRVNKTTSPKIQRFNYPMSSQLISAKPTEPIAVETHPMQTAARARMQTRTQAATRPQVTRPTAKELKEQAIKKALTSANNAPSMSAQIKKSSSKKQSSKFKFGAGRIVLALSCAAAAVFAIAYFVNLNMPDISLRVAAMQTGIDASYPSYVPRNFKLSGVVSENSRIALDFKNSSTDDAFTITEEKSSWDSNALLNNYVKPTYDANYTSIREQGLTIFISDSNAAWVNGGTIYKITAKNNVLTTKQIRSIAVSL